MFDLLPCLPPQNLRYWGTYLENSLGISWSYIGHILSWTYLGHIFGIIWAYLGDSLLYFSQPKQKVTKSYQKLPKGTKNYENLAKVTKNNQKIIKIPQVTNFPYNLSSVWFVYHESLQFCLVFTLCLLYGLSTVYIHVPTNHLHCIYAHEYISNRDRKYRFLFPQTIRRLVSQKAPLACMGFSFWQSTFVRFIHPPPLTGYYITGPCDSGDLPCIINSTSPAPGHAGK